MVYEMGGVADQLVLDGFVSVELVPGHDFVVWFEENRFTRAGREAKVVDLMGRRFWRSK